MRRWGALAALSLAGCATSSVTLFENEGGHATGSVAVLGPAGEETVTSAMLGELQPNLALRTEFLALAREA